ncbi:hypothetical protein SKAU_G00406960 [Synaphobranchus kaupii]|uniref:Protein kinase domain-containing protein n=1 Tax=Synaphobranchus kaupii TaxID=118154 RepID=A0A9Q1ICY7_SYNKA|nr:hypothetical protein SKAU_G00406960 [Synaphobranchus kaupii]
MLLHDVFESRTEVVLIVELISGGELFDFIAAKESLSETEAIGFLKQILQGLIYMHGKEHSTLRPQAREHHAIREGQYKSMCGTPQYIGPEVINNEPLSVASDMWSIGVNTYILLSGISPFQGDTDEETLRNIIGLNYQFPDYFFRDTSAMAKDFIQKLLVKEQSERMTAEECLLHPWIKPLTRKQAASRSRSSINMKSFKKFNAKRKWKMSYNMVRACTRFSRLRVTGTSEDQELRQCESDQEDSENNRASLIRRRRLSSSS